MKQLTEYFAPTPAELNPVDIIWAAGWITKISDDKFSHANWNSWMKNVHNSNKKPSSSIVYEPIIDCNPKDYRTSNTALLRCIRLEKPNYSAITFDLLIWLKSEYVNNTKTWWFPFVEVLLGNFWCNFCQQWTP